MMTMGCCGQRRVTLQGLVSEADRYPASTPQGRRARQRLAYTVAAGRALQVGNRAAYARAMQALRGLGDGTMTTGFHLTASQADALRDRLRTAVHTTGVATGTITDAGTPSPVTRALSSAAPVIQMIGDLVHVGTSIASSACTNCDRTAIDVINAVVSWITSLINGTPPVVPPISADNLHGFVDFCKYKDDVLRAMDPIMSLAVTGLHSSSDVGWRTAGDVLALLQNNVRVLFNGICNAIQSQATIACDGTFTNWTCTPTPPADVPPAPPPAPPPTPPDPRFVRFTPVVVRPGTYLPVLQPPATTASGGGGLVLPAAAAAFLAWRFLF